MGLDMNLYKKTYISQYPEPKIIFLVNGETPKGIYPDRIAYVIENIMYWRKENHIHKWFVDLSGREDDCTPIPVEREDLQSLLETMKRVRDTPELAGSLLPTESGFFFGGTEYDDYYFRSLEKTIPVLEAELATEGWEEYFYRASW